MNVNSVGLGTSVSALDSLFAPAAAGQAGAPAAPASCGSNISGFASAMSSLQQLQQSDPAKFKQVMASIASELEADAKGATGSKAQFLAQLAGKFQQASQTGTMAPLESSSATSTHHGHRHRAAKSYGAQQTAAQTDPAQQPSVDLAQVITGAMGKAGLS